MQFNCCRHADYNIWSRQVSRCNEAMFPKEFCAISRKYAHEHPLLSWNPYSSSGLLWCWLCHGSQWEEIHFSVLVLDQFLCVRRSSRLWSLLHKSQISQSLYFWEALCMDANDYWIVGSTSKRPHYSIFLQSKNHSTCSQSYAPSEN